MTRPLNDKGVSVIIGTLLLILITVTAAAALALMISQMQKAEMTRQSQIQNVHDEDIVISGLRLCKQCNIMEFNLSESTIQYFEFTELEFSYVQSDEPQYAECKCGRNCHQ